MNQRAKIRKIFEYLIDKDQTLSVAESCTGGQIGAALTSVPGASKIFFGGVVSYANSAKHDLLGVSQKLLKNPGAVSAPVVLGMAKGAKKVFGSDWAIAVSGIAGPDGGTRYKPVGLVYYAVVGPHIERVKRKIFRGGRNEVQKQAVEESLGLLLKNLK